MMQRRGTRLRGNEKMSNRNLGVYSDIKVLKDRDFINQSKLSIILYKQECVVRWGCGENPLTPLWLVVDASVLFALML